MDTTTSPEILKVQRFGRLARKCYLFSMSIIVSREAELIV